MLVLVFELAALYFIIFASMLATHQWDPLLLMWRRRTKDSALLKLCCFSEVKSQGQGSRAKGLRDGGGIRIATHVWFCEIVVLTLGQLRIYLFCEMVVVTLVHLQLLCFCDMAVVG